MEIDFAMIDAKDGLLVGIDAERPSNIHNAKVCRPWVIGTRV